MRDRETLLPDGWQRRLVWRSAGGPGAVLVGGRLAAIWQPEKAGKRLRVTVTPLEELSRQDQEEIQLEAATLAPFRGCDTARIVFKIP